MSLCTYTFQLGMSNYNNVKEQILVSLCIHEVHAQCPISSATTLDDLHESVKMQLT